MRFHSTSTHQSVPLCKFRAGVVCKILSQPFFLLTLGIIIEAFRRFIYKTKLMMKRLFLICLTSLLCSLAQAQEKPGTFSIIPRVGVTVADLTNFDWAKGIPLVDHQGSLSSSFKAGAVAGAQVDYQVSDVISASAGVQYALLGTRYADFMVDNGDGTAEGVSDMHVDLHYLQVPLLLNAYVMPGLALKAGVQVGFLLNGKIKDEVTPVTIDAESGAKTPEHSRRLVLRV